MWSLLAVRYSQRALTGDTGIEDVADDDPDLADHRALGLERVGRGERLALTGWQLRDRVGLGLGRERERYERKQRRRHSAERRPMPMPGPSPVTHDRQDNQAGPRTSVTGRNPTTSPPCPTKATVTKAIVRATEPWIPPSGGLPGRGAPARHPATRSSGRSRFGSFRGRSGRRARAPRTRAQCVA